MPRIINAYEGNSAIGDSLSKLGEAIYGDQAKNEVSRQKAFAQKTLNDLVTGDAGLDDPRLAKAQLGIGGTAAGTFAGLGRNNASAERIGAGNNAATIAVGRGNNAETHYATDTNAATSRANNADTNSTTLQSADMTSKRAADTQLAIDGRTLASIDNGDGTSHYDTKSNAAAGNLPVPATKEGVLGGMLRKYAQQQQQQPVDGSAPAPTGNPFSGIPPQVQHVLGVGMPDQSMVHPGSGMTGISRDGGQTVILPNGASIAATGFQPVDQGTALNEARGNIQRAQTAQPLAAPNATGSQAAVNAGSTAGIAPALETHANTVIGALPGGPSLIKGFGGTQGQIAPGVQGARQDQDILAQQTRAILAGATGRQTTQAQKWVDELLPQGPAFANPRTEETKVPKIIGALQGDHEQLRQVVQTTSDPAERTKALVQMHTLEGLIKKWAVKPAVGAAPTAGAPQAAAAPAAPTQTATGPGGQKIGLVNGQWVPM